MTLLSAVIGLIILILINRSLLKTIKNFRTPVNARRSLEVANYKLAKLQSDLDKYKEG
jgi:hypothetical protein